MVRKLWVYACEWMAVLVLALRSGPEAPVPGRARPFPPSGGRGACSGRTKMAAGQAAPSRAKGRCAPAVNCCFRTGTDQGNPTVESKHSIAIATQGFDAM